MNCELTYNNLHITDSCHVHKWDMRPCLEVIKAGTHPGETIVFDRTIFSLKMEWICHNFLYNIGYKREQTKDCDLDNPSDHPEWMYIICGLLTWIFVW